MTATDETAALGTTVLGRFRVVRALAKGGMGTVYLARNEGAAGFVKPVVIKRSLRTGAGDVGDMFAREARILSNLRHPGIVGIVDFAEEGGEYAMVLDYVHGYTLSQWSRYVRKTRGTMPVPLAVYTTLRILDALEYAHALCDSRGKRLGIVHRDIKPSNVLIDVQGLVKLADFGVARTNTEATDTTTGDATLKGTFAYMAPELFGGTAPSPASDVFSAAVTAYQLLAGRNPFITKDAVLTAARTMQHEPDSLTVLRKDVSSVLASVIAKGMCKHPDGRFQTAGDLARALEEACPLDEDAELEFHAAIERDFTDPRFAELNETDTLAEREQAWSEFGDPAKETRIALPLAPSDLEATEVASRMAIAGPPTEVTPRPEPFTADTVALPGGRHTPEPDSVPVAEPDNDPAIAPAPQRRSRTPLVIGLGIAVAGAAVAAAMALRGGDAAESAEPTVVMVRGDVTMEADAGTTAVPAEPPVEPTERPRPTVATKPVPPKPKPKPRSAAQELTATFRARQGDIAACFDRYPEAAATAGALAVRFHVDERGAVRLAELVPGTISGEPLGKCLLGVARSTEFGRQNTPLSFRIPIRVKGG